MNRILYDVVDNEGTKASVFMFEQKYWVDSEIVILKDKKLLEKKSKAIFGPFETAELALDSIPGKFTVDKVSEPVTSEEALAIENDSEEKDEEIQDKAE